MVEVKQSAPLETLGGFERLEPYEGKLSCTVLRGGDLGDEVSLPDVMLAAFQNIPAPKVENFDRDLFSYRRAIDLS
jgi:hypothetical protein